MGRFKAKAVIIRYVNDIKIVFYDNQSIYVFDEKAGWHLFHRLLAPLGSYNHGWRQFRHLLLYEKQLDLAHCYRLAFRYNISSQIAKRAPDISKFNIEERF